MRGLVAWVYAAVGIVVGAATPLASAIICTSLDLYRAVWMMQFTHERFNMGLQKITFCQELQRNILHSPASSIAVELIKSKRSRVLEAGPFLVIFESSRLGFVHPAMSNVIRRLGDVCAPAIDAQIAKAALRAIKLDRAYVPHEHALLWTQLHQSKSLSRDVYEHVLTAYEATYHDSIASSGEIKSHVRDEAVVWFSLERNRVLSISGEERQRIFEAAINWFRFWLFTLQVPPVATVQTSLYKFRDFYAAVLEDLKTCSVKYIPQLRERIDHYHQYQEPEYATFVQSMHNDLQRLALFAEFLMSTIDAGSFFKAIDHDQALTLLVCLDGLYGQFQQLVEQLPNNPNKKYT